MWKYTVQPDRPQTIYCFSKVTVVGRMRFNVTYIYPYICMCVCVYVWVCLYIYIYIACLVKYVELLQISGRPNKRVYKSTTNLFSSCEMFMFQELQKLPNEISECRCWKTIPFTFLISPDIYLTIVRENAQLYQTIPSPFKSACEE